MKKIIKFLLTSLIILINLGRVNSGIPIMEEPDYPIILSFEEEE